MFNLFAAVTVIGLVSFSYTVYTFTIEAKKNIPDGYTEFTSITDFVITVAASGFFMSAEILFRKLLPPKLGHLCRV